MKIDELLNVPRQRHGVAWLKDSLQTAIELELSTLPPYLTALWSIITPQGEVYDLIHSVVFEEMLHFGLACNLLNTIGGEPEIAHWKAVPKYPGPLPGDVRPGLIVPLTGLTRRLVYEVFMEIEYPEDGPIPHYRRSMSSPTIGAFYSAIADAFEVNAKAIQGTRQLVGPPAVPVVAIDTLDKALQAISKIKEQGEGTSKSPLATDFGDELAHYYEFGEIYHGRKFVKDSRATGTITATQSISRRFIPSPKCPRRATPTGPTRRHSTKSTPICSTSCRKRGAPATSHL